MSDGGFLDGFRSDVKATLQAAGVDSAEAVRERKNDELLALDGIGESTIKELRRRAAQEATRKALEGEGVGQPRSDVPAEIESTAAEEAPPPLFSTGERELLIEIARDMARLIGADCHRRGGIPAGGDPAKTQAARCVGFAKAIVLELRSEMGGL